MTKRYIFLSLILIFLNSCAERGSIVPKTAKQTITQTQNDYPKLVVKSNDEVKNRISGSLILMIGLIILL